MQIGPENAAVRAGSVIFVEAEAEHRFATSRKRWGCWCSSHRRSRN